MYKLTLFNLFLLFVNLFEHCVGHGMLLDPVSRSSRWRYDKSAPVNYDDNSLWCGGFNSQWGVHSGKCGVCGDDYGAPRPRANELGGQYGQGVITKTYANTFAINVGAKITVNHLGYIYYNLCNLDEFSTESEECFLKHRLQFTDGSDKYHVGRQTGMIYTTVVLPKGLTCNHCVLRWTYKAANNWNPCENGPGALGCGPQEHYKACADIRIIAAERK